jgi:hypothetical protein
MVRTRRSLAILGSAAVALILVSCGVDAGEGAATSTTAASSASPDLTPQQQELADRMHEAYTGLGFSDEEATCLSEHIAGSIDPGTSTPDITAMMDVINDCDIAMDRLMDIQGNMGDGTAEGALKESLAAGFKTNGMTDEQATCVADAFVDEYGIDVESMTDPDKMLPLAEQCDVDVTDIRPGG